MYKMILICEGRLRGKCKLVVMNVLRMATIFFFRYVKHHYSLSLQGWVRKSNPGDKEGFSRHYREKEALASSLSL